MLPFIDFNTFNSGLHSRHETSEMTIWISYCLFPYIHDYLQLFPLKSLKDYKKSIFQAVDLI